MIFSKIYKKIILLFILIITFFFSIIIANFYPRFNILPATELIVIFYISTHFKIHYWHLFVLGIVTDKISFNAPIGISSLIFILLNIDLINKKNYGYDQHFNLIENI